MQSTSTSVLPNFLHPSKMNTADKAKAIAYADLILLVLGLILVAIFGLIFAFDCNPEEDKGNHMRLLYVGVLVRFVIGSILQLGMIILLLEGVMLRNHKRCAIWIIATKVFLALMLISAIVKLFIDPISIFLELIGIAYKIISLRTVGTYAIELQNDSVFHP